MLRENRSSLIWIVLGLSAMLFRVILNSETIENVYSRGIFLVVRYVFDYLFCWLPFPLIYVWILLVFVLLIRFVKRWWMSRKDWISNCISALLGITAWAFGLLFFFLSLWGFNYGRVSVEDQLGINLHKPDLDELESRIRSEARTLASLRDSIPDVGASEISTLAFGDAVALEAHLREQLLLVLQTHQYPTPGKVRAKIIYPKGIFLRFSSSGLYFPFTGEGQADAGLLPLQRPSVMAHEMAHAYGFGDEGSCSFWAWLACVNSPNPAIAYAGRLSYWRTLASSYLRYRPEEYRAFRDSLPTGIQLDLNAINENLQAYPDIMPRVRYAAYDAYLKAQGIAEGMLNYSRVIQLVEGYRRQYPGKY